MITGKIMANDMYKDIRTSILDAERQLVQAKDLIDRLRKAGEDVTEAEKQYRLVKTRVDRYKLAFK